MKALGPLGIQHRRYPFDRELANHRFPQA